MASNRFSLDRPHGSDTGLDLVDSPELWLPRLDLIWFERVGRVADGDRDTRLPTGRRRLVIEGTPGGGGGGGVCVGCRRSIVSTLSRPRNCFGDAKNEPRFALEDRRCGGGGGGGGGGAGCDGDDDGLEVTTRSWVGNDGIFFREAMFP